MAREGRAEQLVAVEFFHVVFVEQMWRALDELIEAEWRGGRPARTRQFGERAVHFPNEELGDCLVVPGADLLIKCKHSTSTNWNKMGSTVFHIRHQSSHANLCNILLVELLNSVSAYK